MSKGNHAPFPSLIAAHTSHHTPLLSYFPYLINIDAQNSIKKHYGWQPLDIPTQGFSQALNHPSLSLFFSLFSSVFTLMFLFIFLSKTRPSTLFIPHYVIALHQSLLFFSLVFYISPQPSPSSLASIKFAIQPQPCTLQLQPPFKPSKPSIIINMHKQIFFSFYEFLMYFWIDT